MPASMIPRQGLICGDCSVRQLSDEGMNTDLPSSGLILVPVVIVLVLPKQSVVRADIAFQPRIICPGGMHHNSFRDYRFACFIAGVIC